MAENRIVEQVTDLIKQWASKFFSKEELNKRFNVITRKIREEGGRNNSNDREDAMLSKK